MHSPTGPYAAFPGTRFRSLNKRSISKNVPDCNPVGLRFHANTGRWGFCAIYKHFSGFEFFLLPNIVHARPSAMLRERKPLGGNASRSSDKMERMNENDESSY